MSDKTPPPGYAAVFPESGFNSYAGPIFQAEDGSHFLFKIREHHLNSAQSLHGGMAMAIADIAMGRTVRAAIEPQKGATISLNCDFLGTSALGDVVIARVEITRKTRSIVFVSGNLKVGERTILTATGLWKILDTEG